MSHKLKSVIRHEYLTIVKQPAFLLTMLALPIFMAAIFGLSYFAQHTADSNIDEAAERVENVVVIDESGLIDPDIVAASNLELRPTAAKEATVEAVIDEELSGVIIYPEKLKETRQFEVIISGGDDFVVSSAISEVASQLLHSSLIAPIGDPEIVALIQQGTTGDLTTYEDGERLPGAAGYIVPGVFLAIFFIVLLFSMGYMLLGVAEEKENRSMEMVLSYVRPRTLITGKLFGVSLVALTQLLFFLTLTVTGIFTARRFEDQIGLPLDIDFSTLVFDPMAIIIGFLVLVFGFLFFAALMSGVASMVPGVKEANSFSSVFFILPFLPFYSFGVITTAPGSALVKFLTFFPITSPTTLLFRNTFGNIDAPEAAAAITVLIASTVLAFLLAAKLFRLGALEFNDRLKLSSLFKK
ncbi:MAG: ABC transporter permease [Candidatus Saccharimonadales bacterium]